MTKAREPTKKRRSIIAVFAFAGVAFVVFGIIVQVGIIELEPGDGALNIIAGLVILIVIPFTVKKKKTD